jgi:hypothetical protein
MVLLIRATLHQCTVEVPAHAMYFDRPLKATLEGGMWISYGCAADGNVAPKSLSGGTSTCF